MKALLGTVKALCDRIEGSIDAVFLAGDLAHSGKKDEYDRFAAEFYQPLREIPAVIKSRVFAVPGNHDVDCTIGVPITWEGIQKRNHETFFAEDDDGRRLRQHRAEVFRAYLNFVTEYSIESPNPTNEVSMLYETPEYPVDILAVNTAFFSDVSENRNPSSTPVPLASIRQRLESGLPKKPLLILGHHSMRAFRPDQLALLKPLLIDNKAFMLHGHEHFPEAVFNSDATLRSFGFGAAYVQSLDNPEGGEYTNSFTYCDLSGQLAVTCFSWEHAAGRWIETTAMRLADCGKLKKGGIDAVLVTLPNVEAGATRTSQTTPLVEVPRAYPRLSKVIPIAAPNDHLWKRLLSMSDNVQRIVQAGAYAVNTIPASDGKWQAIVESAGETHLVICIAGANHIMSAKEVEGLNTRLDTEAYATVTVISLGLISDEARTMYLQLQARKPIEIVANTDISAKADRILSPQQAAHLSALDAATDSALLLVADDDMYCLVHHASPSSASFYLLDRSGSRLNPSSPVVTALRKASPQFERIQYLGEQSYVPVGEVPDFDERDYLIRAFREYNSTKYAALANVGLRFSELPLKDLYVSATAADVSEQGAGRLEGIVEDHLARFATSDALKQHIRQQLLSSISKETHRETSDAREFCQRYGSVLLTGDPGSGKTCFVKNEILAYCDRVITVVDGPASQGWHSTHIPVLVPLSEVVGERDFDEAGMFAIASRLLERKGLVFPHGQMSAMATQGRLALFFDGLDEVVSIEKRATVVRQVNELVEDYLAKGNRFVVTSRPAAVHVVNLLPALHKLELQGLSEDSIRLLADRVLSLRVVEAPEGVLVDESKSPSGDRRLVDKLLEDCRRNPGIGRLAQNPLLLTLLILIYANSGAPSAKRHLIYEEAIKTLSSVRSREAGLAPISAQDLRERLGAVALSVYRRESGLLPTRFQVREQVKHVMEKQRGETVSLSEADEFIQKVAESTGLVSIEERNNENADAAVVTFMHHSFLEYFAAIGLSLDLDAIKLEELVHEPRWHEILTLLAGIVGENADIAPIISEVLHSSTAMSDVDARLLAFAIDCALESEIPSEAAQRLIAKGIAESIRSGPARVDPWVRSELGRRLAALFASCGSAEFERVLVDLIRNGSDDECAAAIRMSGYACAEADDGFSEIAAAMSKACSRTSDSVLCAICWTASEAKVLRTDTVLQLISTSLSKSRRRKQAAFEAIAKIPGLAGKHWAEIINGLDDSDRRVRRAASIAAVQAGLNAELIALNKSKKDILLRALKDFGEGVAEGEAPLSKLKRETVESMLDSPDRRNRLLGIGFLPMVNQSERYVYERLLGITLGRRDREETAAALISLRYSGDALSLLTDADLKAISSYFEDGTADIRLAAIRLLGVFSRSVTAVRAILRLSMENLDDDDYVAATAALGGAKVCKDEATSAVAAEVDTLLNAGVKMNEHYVRRIGACLRALRRLAENVPEKIALKIDRAIDDYRLDRAVRAQALLALAGVSIPSEKLVKRLTALLERASPESETELVQVPSVLAQKCRQTVEYVIACVGELAELRSAAITLHQKLRARAATPENEDKVTELRGGIDELTSIMVAFKEFIDEPGVTGD